MKQISTRPNSNRNSKTDFWLQLINYKIWIFIQSYYWIWSKYIQFIKFNVDRQILRAWEYLRNFRKRRETKTDQAILMKIKPSDSKCLRALLWRFQAPIYKIMEFLCFARRKITDKCLFTFILFFSRGDQMKRS